MDAKMMGDVLRFIAQNEVLGKVDQAFPTCSLDDIRSALLVLADQVSPRLTQEPNTVSFRATRVTLKTDGGSRGNPGPSGAGWVVFGPAGEIVATGNEFLGRRTNNEAEYAAVLLGLQAIFELGYTEVDLRLDSDLLVKQIKGVYRVKKAHLKPLYEQACLLLKKFDDYSIAHVYRIDNKEADEQANLAMDRGY